MKKLLLIVMVVMMAFAFGSCRRRTAPVMGEEVERLLREHFPEQMRDGRIRVAVIRNLAAGDHTQQFLEGAFSEGTSMGFEVVTIVTDGDSVRAQDAVALAIQQDFDGIILSHGEAGWTYDALRPAVERGIRVVTFDSVPFRGGNPNNPILTGVTSTAQADYDLAELSIGSIINYFPAYRRPLRVVRAWMGPGIPPLDRRQIIYDRFVRDGYIEEVALVGPVDFANPRGGTHDAFAAMLARFPPGSVDAIWGSFDELAKGCLQALNDAGRNDIRIMSIDIANDNINLMQTYSDIWISTAAVDPRLIGIVNMRLLAAKFAGEPTPDTFEFAASLVYNHQLNPAINMTNVAAVVPGWGEERGVWDHFPWMREIKAAVLRQ